MLQTAGERAVVSGDPKTNQFKLPGSSLDEVFKALQGYASLGRAGALSDISKNTGLHETVVSRNVGFLLSLDLLEGGRNKSSTAEGSRLGLALMHNVPEEVERILSNVVSENEFLKNVLAAVRIRKGMDEGSLRSHIAYSAGLSKTGSTGTGAGAVIELLKRSGHLRLEDGKLNVSTPATSAVVTDEATAPSSSSVVGRSIVTALTPDLVRSISGLAQLSISIEIKVNCQPSDLDDLGTKLHKLIDDVSKQNIPQANEE